MIEVKRILLAEDNAYDVELTLEALSENNLANQVDIVNDGVQTMEYLRYEGKYASREKGNPAVILLDLKMPRQDGLETLAEIRRDEKLKMIPVVILTSSKEERDLVKGYELGANAYVVKPVDFDTFRECVKLVGGFWAYINEIPPEKG